MGRRSHHNQTPQATEDTILPNRGVGWHRNPELSPVGQAKPLRLSRSVCDAQGPVSSPFTKRPLSRGQQPTARIGHRDHRLRPLYRRSRPTNCWPSWLEPVLSRAIGSASIPRSAAYTGSPSPGAMSTILRCRGPFPDHKKPLFPIFTRARNCGAYSMPSQPTTIRVAALIPTPIGRSCSCFMAQGCA